VQLVDLVAGDDVGDIALDGTVDAVVGDPCGALVPEVLNVVIVDAGPKAAAGVDRGGVVETYPVGAATSDPTALQHAIGDVIVRVDDPEACAAAVVDEQIAEDVVDRVVVGG